MPLRRLLLALLLMLAGPAYAQVTINPEALQPAPAAPAAKPKPKPAVKHPAPAKKPAPAAPASEPPAAVRLVPVEPLVVPAAPPLPAVLAPLNPPPPPHPSAPPPVPPVAADAVGDALPIKDGLRTTFGADSAALNPRTDAALRKLGHDAAGSPDTIFDVAAYAAGEPDDPSLARRLALDRALSVRAVLISQGIPSTRIYVRALGARAGDGPADRVDVTLSNVPQSTPPKASPTPPP
jgi:outer membrane protein OmpA-like peptidoglycan-associated protein